MRVGSASTVLFLVACMSCRGAPVVELPRRVAPAGYPVPRSEDLPGTFVTIPEAEIARALSGRRYRVRWGTLQLPGPDDAVDALTGAHGFPAEGPFEQEIEVAADEVHVTVASVDVSSGQASAHRLIGCVDVRPSHLPAATNGTVVVLDVQPVGDAPPMPFAIDAVTGERLPMDASRLLDENNMPCDRRSERRAAWDDNLLRRRRSRTR